MTSEERILNCIRKHKGEAFEGKTHLISDGLLDSIDIIELIDIFEQEFDIIIPMEEADPDYFDNLASIERLIKRNGGNI